MARAAIRILARDGAGNFGRLDTSRLWKCDRFEVIATRWNRRQHPSTSRGFTRAGVVEFMRVGAFIKRSSRGVAIGDANSIVTFAPGEEFAIRHPPIARNEGVSIRVEPVIAEEVGVGRSGHPCCPCSAGAVVQVAALLSLLRRGLPVDPLDIQERIVRLLALAATRERQTRPGPRWSARAQRVLEAALDYMHASAPRRVSLGEIAAAADASVWMVERVFRMHAGCGVYQSMLALRLRAAISDLGNDRTGEVGPIAQRAGFGSHSQFSAHFRREFGLTPSEYRRTML